MVEGASKEVKVGIRNKSRRGCTWSWELAEVHTARVGGAKGRRMRVEMDARRSLLR